MPNNLHIKGSRTRVLNSFPTSSMGNEGDIIIAKIQGRGVYLCTKAANTWYVANRLQEARNVENSSIRNLKTNQITIDRLTESTKDTDKFIVSDEGVLKYRTSGEIVDDLDIPIVDIYYKNAYCSLGQYNNEEDCIANGGEWYYSDNDSYDNISSSAENELLTIGRSIGNLDAEPTLLYDGSTLEIKYNSNYDDNWQTSAQTNLLKLSYDSSNNAIFNVDSSGDLTLDVSGDIELNADGGDIAFKDASADLAALSSSGLTISNISEVGSDTDKILMSDSGVVKYVTGANLRSYIGAGTSSVAALNDLSDVTYSSGDLTISSLDTIISGALVIDSSGKISLDSTNDSNSAIDGTTFKTAGTEFAAITSHHALSTLTLYEAGGSSTDDYFTISVDAAGATTLETVDAGGAGGNITLSPDGVINLTKSINITSGRKLYLDGGGDTFIVEESADLVSFYVGNSALLGLLEDATTSTAQSSKVFTGCPILLKDVGGVADTPNSGYGSLYVNSDVLYFKTDGGTATNLLSGGGGTTRWTRNTGGYATNKTSTTLYYFQYRPNSEFWSNSDSSPTSINQYDASACQFHAPADGTLTNISASGYVNDTGATDPFKFYVYKGTPTNDATSTSLTLIGTSDAPATISSAARTFSINTDISSSNSFSAGDAIFIMWKKDSNTGSQDVYFSVTISGEYD